MQTTPVAPAPPVRPTVTFTVVDGAKQTLMIPMTRQDVAALRSQRRELSNQIESASDRRHQLSEEIKSAPDGASRIGLEQRLTVLDKRIVQLESDLASTGQQLSAAPQGLVTSTENASAFSDNAAAMSGAFIMFVLFPIVLAFARNIWKRGSRTPAAVQSQLSGEATQRLERLEQGMDAIAIEIERVAEGQRFVTRILSEGQQRLPANAIEPEMSAENAQTRLTPR